MSEPKPLFRTPLQEDNCLGNYRLVCQLGAGGAGVVYKAVDLKLQRTVALKFLATPQIEPADCDRLLREARAASALDHPNIATVYAVEQTAEGRLFIVMAYYEGATLAEKIQSAPLPAAEAVGIARQIARGLGHAHAHSIVHRDIKPSNIMITKEGVAKIVDFGLARVLSSSASTLSLGFAGTLAYMSPEQAAGKSPDARSDLWALGVLLYQMLTGKLPFQGDSFAATVVAILNSPPPSMEEIAPGLQPIIRRALSKEPNARYQSSSQLLRDLEQIDAEGSGVTSAGVGRDMLSQAELAAGGRTVTSAGRRRVGILAAAALLLIVSLSLLSLRRRVFPDRQPKHVVVLPFDNLGGSATGESLSDGLAERITGRLSNLGNGQPSLWVVPATEVRSRKITDASAARREFGATMAVKGSLRPGRTGMQLTLDLIDTQTLRLLGSARLEEQTIDLSALEDDAIGRLAALLHIPVTSEPRRAAGAKAAPAAYESYLTGLGFLQRFDKAGNLDAAIAQFEGALKTDPGFVLAYAALGEAYWDKYRLDQDPQWVDQAAAYCKRAAEIDDQLPAVYITLGRIHNGTGQHDLALQEFQKALKLEPNDPGALLGIAAVYESMGRAQDAENAYKRAAAMRPGYWDGYYQLGVFYYRQRRFAEAAGQFRQVLELTPDNAQTHSTLGVMLRNLGQNGEAELQFKKSLELHPTYAAYANLGNLYYKQKRYAESVAMTEQALQLNDKDYMVWANLGLAYQWLKQPAQAAAAYEQELARLQQTARLRADDPAIQCELGLLYARRHSRRQAAPHLEAALAHSPDDPRILADAAEAYTDLGDRQRALALAARALDKGRRLQELEEEPDMQPLLSDAAFQDLLRKRQRENTAAVTSPAKP